MGALKCSSHSPHEIMTLGFTLVDGNLIFIIGAKDYFPPKFYPNLKNINLTNEKLKHPLMD